MQKDNKSRQEKRKKFSFCKHNWAVLEEIEKNVFKTFLRLLIDIIPLKESENENY